MMSDASDMLAAALEQMDGIIAGKVLPLKHINAPFYTELVVFFFFK